MSLPDILALIESDRGCTKRIAIVGDTLLDEWMMAAPSACQDGCAAVRLDGAIRRTPGGAAGAARQLAHWSSRAFLIGPVSPALKAALRGYAPRVDTSFVFECDRVPNKGRYVDGEGRVFFRADWEAGSYGPSAADLIECRDLALQAIRSEPWDAVLLVDYEKGFLGDALIRETIRSCRERNIPVLADPKRSPAVFDGALLKINADYHDRHCISLLGREDGFVVTRGGQAPVLGPWSMHREDPPQKEPSRCVNHVGAGDCFGMHLALALVHTSDPSRLSGAVEFADAAARVYVQHPEGRPPWPHEIARQADPVRGKVFLDGLHRLRESLSGRVVFTNGLFRWPHAGHAWLLDWARRQGDVLIVGVNNDESAARLRPGEYIMPLAERVEILAGLSCVDWIVPFGADTPEWEIGELKPDVLVKGAEYRGQPVPGAALVSEVRFAPASPYPDHCTNKIELIRGG